eukprot:gnl/TRDRNA2_/TRDRNA2_189801_c0_seq1.p1 gnl/TRDRNA2_/TRDRNA2_189801_c0~~gnl/TRDRNA2_/TRDRNA2_189801_c0_seq1.p1  ORF type:complete len:189 (+),score=41.93 gnl/TRDRNA2_/TRDRNA2_189801_c0_seq1:84-650(+)
MAAVTRRAILASIIHLVSAQQCEHVHILCSSTDESSLLRMEHRESKTQPAADMHDNIAGLLDATHPDSTVVSKLQLVDAANLDSTDVSEPNEGGNEESEDADVTDPMDMIGESTDDSEPSEAGEATDPMGELDATVDARKAEAEAKKKQAEQEASLAPIEGSTDAAAKGAKTHPGVDAYGGVFGLLDV